MKRLITGGAGFIGSAVVRAAVAAGHEVINLDKLTYAANLANVAQVAEHPIETIGPKEHREARKHLALVGPEIRDRSRTPIT